MARRYNNVSTRTAATSKDIDLDHNTGPFIAIVVNNVDPTYMGRLTVVLQSRVMSGDNPNAAENQIVVDYCPPFFGATPIQGLRLPDNIPGTQGQKSYGMWFVPPDIGSKVLVIFTEGNQGFWIGCIPEFGMNFMTPGVDVATQVNNEDRSSTLPVVEYKKTDVSRLPEDVAQVTKPVNAYLLQGAEDRGLLRDPTRGFTTSSAQRETPSTVFGISTPGPKDRIAGPVKERGVEYFNRLGGSSFVMDDGDARFFRIGDASDTPSEYADQTIENPGTPGEDFDDTIPHNEMIRLKTRTGHQILLHNSEDLIYIGNSKGTAWIELTSNGKIDIYSKDSISVHTETDINFKADRDINFEAGRNFNVKANKNITQESVENFQLVIGTGGKITTLDRNLDIDTKNGGNNFTANSSTNIRSKKGNNYFAAEFNTHIRSNDGNTNIFSGVNTNIKSGGNHIEETGGVIHMNGPSALDAEPADTAKTAEPLPVFTVQGAEDTILKRVPQREPWLHHENLDPLNFAPDKTDIQSKDPAPESSFYRLTRDTFKADNG